MKTQPVLNWLAPLIVLLALITAGTGLFWQDAGQPFHFTTLRGQTVQMYGRGLYRYDSYLKAPIFRGTDAVTLFTGVPLLALSFLLYRRGSLRGALLLVGVLGFFLYYSASLAFSAAFNPLFLAYTILFSASFFAFVYALTGIDRQALVARLSPRLPRRGLAAFMFVAGSGVIFIWMSELIGPLLTGQAPESLGAETTLFTHALDIGLIGPTVILTGVYLLRRAPIGYLLAAPLLVLFTLTGVVVIAQTVAHTLAGITFPVGVYIGLIGSWVILGTFAIGLAVSFFRNLADTPPPHAGTMQPRTHAEREMR